MSKTLEAYCPDCRRFIATRRGATAVEFALIAPIFLILVFGIFEMSRAMWIKAALQFAVEEAARYAIVNSSATTSTLVTYAQTQFTNSGLSAVGVTFTATQDTVSSVNYMSVTGSYSFSVLVPIVPIPDVTLNSKSRVPLPY